MNQRVIISGFFLRQNAWPSAADAQCFDDWRDVQGMDLNGWLDRAQAALATCVEPLTLCGHSFGGYLAQCLAARLGERVSHLCLFSGLVSEGGSALESYQESRQSALMSLCRLEAAEGRFGCRSRRDFASCCRRPSRWQPVSRRRCCWMRRRRRCGNCAAGSAM
ncbi:Alpha/beta hydrolase family [Serratia rubidaea]|uniref:Alpha/beta hydrolase family n=1 Tax=Serratia rubidaea TaxID=61652 RepID=A0A4U9HI22_SERRU|nr:Alpha/beta hydrolase family [Serratia rubidaea]